MLISVSLVFVAFLVTPTATAMATTTIYVEPQSIIMWMEENFSVNITIANVVDLCGWDFKLYYSNSVLNGTSITEGSFLKTGGNTYFYMSNFTDAYNATHGLVRAVCTLFAPTGVNGGGDLAKISFKAKGFGKTLLGLTNTIIVDSAFPPNTIPHYEYDGWVVVPIPGDVNGDFAVDWQDLLVVLVGYGATPADPRWELYNLERADFNCDNQIFWQDLLTVLVNYGKSA